MNHRILRNAADIRALGPEIAELLAETGQAEDVTLGAKYFLLNNPWRGAPVVIPLREGGKLVAVLYGRERCVLGIGTGTVQFGDYYGEGGVIAKPDFKATAVAWGASQALKQARINSVRASFKVRDQNDLATVEKIVIEGKIKARLLPETVQHVLPLKNTFDGFLNTLGSHTRRNLRVYRRRVEQKGWKFVPRLSPAEAAAAFQALERQQGKHKSSPHYLACCRAVLEEVPGSLHAGICTETGEWVSLASGWLRDDEFFMLVQLNDARYARDSISTVMRSYLIENLIEGGVTAMNFVGGCSELLRNFCAPQLCAHYLFEKRGVASALRELTAPRFFGHSMVSRIVRRGTPVPAPAGQAAGQDSDDVEQIVLECWRWALGRAAVDAGHDFFTAPGDLPLLAERLFERISARLGRKLPSGLLVESPTPRKLAARIRELGRVPLGCLVPLQKNGGLPPLYMVHHLPGEVLRYRPLADCFAPERPVYGVEAPVDLTERAEPYSVESLAARYVKEILERQTAGPFHLAGFSTGSVLAFEMARQLREKGKNVGLLALIDGEVRGPGPALPQAQRVWKMAVRKACKIVFKLRDELREGPAHFVAKRLRYLWFLWTVRNLEKAAERGETRKLTVEQALTLAENAYRPQPYAGAALLIRFYDQAWKYGPNPLMGWQNLVESIEAVDCPGGHLTGLSPARAPQLAALLTAHMEKNRMAAATVA